MIIFKFERCICNLSIIKIFFLFIDIIFFDVELLSSSQGYIQVFLDGGLNQQRMGVSDWYIQICRLSYLGRRLKICEH